MASNKDVAHNKGGLVRRIELAHETSPTISWVITLLLLMIEVGPIFFKMMINKSAYDYLQQNQDLLTRAKAGIEVMGDVIHSDPRDPSAPIHERTVDHFHQVQSLLEEERQRFATERALSRRLHELYETRASMLLTEHVDRALPREGTYEPPDERS